MTRTVGCFLFLVAWLLGSAPLGAQEQMRIAAIVNDDVISFADFEARVRLMIVNAQLEDTPDTRRRVAPQALRKLIDENLQLQEAKRIGASPTDADVAAGLASIEAMNNMPRGSLEAATKRDNIDFEQLRQQIRAEIAWARVVRRSPGSNFRITDEEIDIALNTIKENANRPQFLLAEIFLAVDNTVNEGEVLGLAERIAQQVRSGAPFPGLARQFSQNATAALGGDLGWMHQGQLAEEIETALRGMQVGQLSQPIRSLAGYHLVLLRDKRVGGAASLSPDSTIRLAQVHLPIGPKASPSDVKSQVDLVRLTADTAENCDDLVRLAKELGSKLPGQLPEMKIAALAPELRQAVLEVPVGRNTQPLKVAEGVAVFKVCERTEKSNIPTRDQIRMQIERERLDVVARRQLRDLRRSAFVDVRL